MTQKRKHIVLHILQNVAEYTICKLNRLSRAKSGTKSPVGVYLASAQKNTGGTPGVGEKVPYDQIDYLSAIRTASELLYTRGCGV